MKNGIFFESDGGWLHNCLFTGYDNEGRARWLIVDQGEPSMTLQQYEENLGLGSLEFRLLCLEGEKPMSKTIACLLGAVAEGIFLNQNDLMSQRIKELKLLGVDWHRDALKFRVHVSEYYDEDSDTTSYSFYISGEDMGCVADISGFKTLGELMERVHAYFDALENMAGIEVREKKLEAPSYVMAKISAQDKAQFYVLN